MLQLIKLNNLRTPDCIRIVARCGNSEVIDKSFYGKTKVDDEIFDFVEECFNKNTNPFLASKGKAEVYYDIDWDSNNVYYGYIQEV